MKTLSFSFKSSIIEDWRYTEEFCNFAVENNIKVYNCTCVYSNGSHGWLFVPEEILVIFLMKFDIILCDKIKFDIILCDTMTSCKPFEEVCTELKNIEE